MTREQEYQMICDGVASTLTPIYGSIDNFPTLVKVVAEFSQRTLDDWRDDNLRGWTPGNIVKLK